MLESVMLIDDNKHDNFFHEMAISETGLAHSVLKFQSAEKALEFLSDAATTQTSIPQLILLDINMPAVDGWDFLREYARFPAEVQARITVIMLTTSINPQDFERAKGYPTLKGFYNKPLTEEMFIEIVTTHFNNGGVSSLAA